MPIRPELRKFYGKEWREVTRPRILARADDCCEECGKPNGSIVYTVTGRVVIAPGDVRPFMFWVAEGGSVWRDRFGQRFPTLRLKALPRKIRVVIAVVHLDHTPGHDTDDNLEALCQWCHLNYDKLHHHETRATRKDAARPLLATSA